jgi:antitoxin (DNA-binding transcriptional repressor) of toxin-antitoxin stability system
MRSITATELRQRLGEILDAASAGETILIKGDHLPLVYLVACEDGEGLVGREEKRIGSERQALDALVEFGNQRHRNGDPDPDGEGAAGWVRWTGRDGQP